MSEKTILMKKEICWPEYYVCNMNRYIHSTETWYFDRGKTTLSRNYEN